MYEPGSPSSPLATMNFCSPSAARVNCTFLPAGKPAPPRPRTFATPCTTCSSSSLEGVRCSRAYLRPDQSPGRVSTGSSSTLCHLGSAAACVAFRDHAVDRAGPRVDRVAVADRRGGWQKPRQTVSAREVDHVLAALAERQVELRSGARPRRASPVAAKHAVPVQTRMWRLPRGVQQVVVEARHPVNGRLRHARTAPARAAAAIVVGDLAVVLDSRFPSTSSAVGASTACGGAGPARQGCVTPLAPVSVERWIGTSSSSQNSNGS